MDGRAGSVGVPEVVTVAPALMVMLLFASKRMLLPAPMVIALATVMSRVACRKSSENPVTSAIWIV
jgi:hypothetical protein